MAARLAAAGGFAAWLGLGAAAASPPLWVEVRSPHFIVVSDAGEKAARGVAAAGESFRGAFPAIRPGARVDAGRPVVILAIQDAALLRELLPGFAETAGGARPSGLFAAGEERHYVAVQVGHAGADSYHSLYHEYVHLLNRLNFPRLPVWLNEGLAEVYAGAVGDAATAERRPLDEPHLRALGRGPRLPLTTLLTVDHASPHYREAGKALRFYAESWALTHLLLVGSDARRGQLDAFIALLARGVPDLEAARQSFADLGRLEQELAEYTRRPAFRSIAVPAPAGPEASSFAARELAPAEVLAVRGDFLLHTHRPAEARAALLEALQADPRLAAAQEALGHLALLEDKRSEALRRFRQAVETGSRSYLSHYYAAMLLAEQAGDAEHARLAEEYLERAVALHPAFAPGHAALSGFYATRATMLAAALAHARQAAALAPDAHDFQLNVARILLRMERVEEAIAHGERVRAASASDEERRAAEAFLAAARAYRRDLPASGRAGEADAERRGEDRAASGDETPDAASAASLPRWGAGKTRRVVGSGVEGWITQVRCRARTMELHLDLGAYDLRLRASDYFLMGFHTRGWALPEDFEPCRHLKGRRAMIIYRAVEGKPYAGEILAVELRR